MKTIVNTPEAPAAVGPYSQAIAAGPWLFTAGQIPLVPETGELVEGGIAVQTTRVLENLAAVLHANGMRFSDVVKTTVFLTDLGDFQEMNAVYATFFGDAKPARSTIQVAALPKGATVEIEAIAMK
jgi:2-iminobutanoate/2-iminopropanoate deaminase